MRIRNSILLTILISLIIIIGSGYWITREHLNSHLRDLSIEYMGILGDTVRDSLTHYMSDGATATELEEFLRGMERRNKNIANISLSAAEGVKRQFGLQQLMPEKENGLKLNQDKNGPLLSEEDTNGRKLAHFQYPMHADPACLRCHHVSLGERMGTLSISIDVTHIENTMRQNSVELLALNIAQIILFLLVTLVLLNRLLFSRLEILLASVRSVAKGGYKVDLHDTSNDEMGRVFKAFTLMARKIQELIYERDEYIHEQTTQLDFLQQMSQVLSKSQAINDTLGEFAETFTRSVHVTCARIALFDEKREKLSVHAVYPLRGIAGKVNPDLCCQKELCPFLWEIIESKHHRFIDHSTPLNDCERTLLDTEGNLFALLIPIIGKSEVHGLVTLIEARSKEREPLDETKANFCMALAHQLGAAIEHGRLQDRLIEQSKQAVLAMADAVDKKSPWTAGHSRRVTDIAVRIAHGLGWSNDQVEELRMSGLLHDIGKIGVPEGILNKPGRLTDNERKAMQKHPTDGAQIIGRISQLTPIIPAILHHHEYFDGGGYPDGLMGEQIPLPARVLGVADAYDAMVSDRPYRQGLSHDEALQVIRKGAGAQFDPAIVEVFLASSSDSGSPI